VPDRGALGVLVALRPAHRGRIFFHDRGHHQQSGASSASATRTVSGTAGALVSISLFWYFFCTAVPFLTTPERAHRLKMSGFPMTCELSYGIGAEVAVVVRQQVAVPVG
jgi:hypothetical protein